MTSSRVRSDVATYFDVCCEVNGDDSPTAVRVLYPTDFVDDGILQSIKQFCFPTGNEKSEDEAVQLFTFVLTDAQSQYTFGYCRRTPVTNICLCILSGLTWTNNFYKFLNHISNVMLNGTRVDLESLLTNAYHIDIPDEGGILRLDACTEIGKFRDEIPDTRKLPSLRTDRFMLEFYNAVSEKQMIALYASVLKERRIIFTGRKLNQLSSCVFALSKLMFPFHWQNLFIPILPRQLTDMLMAPMPYLIGVPKSTFQQVNMADAGEIIVADLDDRTFESPFVDAIPGDALGFLRDQLKSSSEMFLSDGLARSFLQTNVLIFGKYASGIVTQGETSAWNKQAFLDAQRPSIQPFLNSILSRDGVQYFERFIEERLMAINRGTPIVDEFERELRSSDLRRFLDRQASAVRENASDVIVALKDRVQAISLRDTFGRFTPKEVRRVKLRPGKIKSNSAKKKGIDPLSIDATEYHFNNPLSTLHHQQHNGDGDGSLNERSVNIERVSDAESVSSSSDLIDLYYDEDGVDSGKLTPVVVEHPVNSNQFASSSASSSASAGTTMADNGENVNGRRFSGSTFSCSGAGTIAPSRLDKLLFNDFFTCNKPFNPTSSIISANRADPLALAQSQKNENSCASGFPSRITPIATPSINFSAFVTDGTSSKTIQPRKNWETFE